MHRVIAGGSEWPEYKWRYGSYDQFTGAVDDINNLTSDLQLHVGCSAVHIILVWIDR